ncbi:uncharacterized protein LOC133531441 isoform X2 [Cydia pomonella]|uniref:uncharacterized protein LOC133531441 isoform X2 n=1 Tax=Cydia pomonella TaxID=82600 RepID=UPI002ADDE41F|nr:uncharacterized protein LOC133531441 isoform X2 [Cydia pomonella]
MIQKLVFVLTAARCFWDKGKQLPASRFEVARTFRVFGIVWQSVQKSKVSTIHLPPSYQDSAGSYANDIALLTLAKPLRGVIPICVSFNKDLEKRQLTEGNFGRNMGKLQRTGNGLPPSLFTALEVPYVSRDRCDQGELYYREQLTYDKICTGFKPGAFDRPESLICRGDHGSGLAFYSGTEWNAVPYLRGVASTPFRAPSVRTYNTCSTYRYAAFTLVSSHQRFLEQHIPGIEDKCAQYYRINADDTFECNCHCKNNTTST